jgi:hypothetical protein
MTELRLYLMLCITKYILMQTTDDWLLKCSPNRLRRVRFPIAQSVFLFVALSSSKAAIEVDGRAGREGGRTRSYTAKPTFI